MQHAPILGTIFVESKQFCGQCAGLRNASVFIPQDDPETGVQKGLIGFWRVDSGKTLFEIFHSGGGIRFLHQQPVKKLFLQPFVDRDTVVFSGLSAPESTQMAAFVELLKPFVLDVSVRG